MANGQLTFPFDVTVAAESLRLMKKWGADAIRDCDGTVLPEKLDLDVKTYFTYFVTRGDNKWANANKDESQHFLLMSERVTALKDSVEISLMKGYLREQVVPDFDSDPKKYWEVIDRTTNELVDTDNWEYSKAEEKVIVKNAQPMHEYTVSFFAVTLWDSTQMYNYITNNWSREKERPYDPRYPKTNEYIKMRLTDWVKEHPDTDVVRFTTFFYHFTLLYNEYKKEKFVDWFGYSASVSPKAFDEFQEKYGYALRAEDIVDEGYYNALHRMPTKAYLDYIEFVSEYVCGEIKQLVDIVHDGGKEAMMFLGDNWIGTEPYGSFFAKTGIDAVVGSVGSGVTVRMLSDIPGLKYTEGRFLPYFFPDTFYEGGNPVGEFNNIWLRARRAILRKPIDRIGFGGYLNLAAKFPDFVNRVTEVADEYRTIYKKIKNSKPYTMFRVGILNGWGKLRSWQSYMVAHELWYKQTYSFLGIPEILSGFPAEISFFSFEDILNTDALSDVDVIINAGLAGTAFSGGDVWKNPELTQKLRMWVHNGGALIGIGEPSAVHFSGRYFQLASCMGVDKELGFSLSTNKYNVNAKKDHFILADNVEPVCYGEGTKNIFALDGAEVLDIDKSGSVVRESNIGEVRMAANRFGSGYGFYMAGCPYSEQNSRILLRAICYCMGKESLLKRNFSENIYTEYHYYPDLKMGALINNSAALQATKVYLDDGSTKNVTIEPYGIVWL